jgi:hypothetical protein
MTPESRGYVGINKMSPTCALDVTGDGKISGTLNSGNLGINKTPTCALDVTGDGSISGTLTTNNLTVNGNISGNFTMNDIKTGNITNTYNISTETLTATSSITGGGSLKIGSEATPTSGGLFRAGRINSFLPNLTNSSITPTTRGLEIFWNTVNDSRNIYDSKAGDTTFMNYAGGLGQGGYSFQTSPGGSITTDPTMLFEMVKGKNFTVNGGLNATDEINISNNGESVKLSYITPTINVPFNNNLTSTFQMYYSALDATCYSVACPLIIKDASRTFNYNVQLEFPIPEFIYVNVASNNVYIVLPYVNQTIGNVNVSTQTFRFRIRQMTGGKDMYLKTYSDSLYPTRTGGNIYDFLNNQQSSPYYSGAWYEEVHYYMGNWYVNRLS